MKKPIRQKGLVLVVCILALAVIAAEMYVLISSSNTILFQTNNTYLQACQQNLTSSALSWIEYKSLNDRSEDLDKTIKLDTNLLGVKKANLDLTITKSLEEQTEVQIKTSCQRGKIILKQTQKIKLP